MSQTTASAGPGATPGSDDKLAHVLATFPEAKREYLIPILQAVQESQGFLSREAIVRIAGHLGLPASKVFGVATFYNQFRFQSQGRFNVQVCRGTACHVKGSAAVLNAVKRGLKVEPGQTTRDGVFSLEVVACIGACGLAPVITAGGDFHAAVQPDKVNRILQSYRKRAADDAA
jgi:NADH-quinone oxidoreductase subunit E